MKKILISVLRNRDTSMEHFRQVADQLGALLAVESAARLPKTNICIETPLATTQGETFKQHPVLVPILRSGLVMLPPFLRFYPGSLMGFLGMRRDEITILPELYYVKLPLFTAEDPIFLLDPMIATGGSSSLAVKILKNNGARESKITLISFIASPEGIAHFHKECPEAGLLVAQVDEGLDANKFIVPGLGDFGDRYFGTDFPRNL